ncbi:hypothetical protein [Aliivibrio salmonicida]|uniref:hypothetical protein n=1 Tax=Aliivibrio salmonicida TaxID=40269 RepID=UPI003D110F0F
MIVVKINKSNVRNVAKSDVESLISKLDKSSFIDLKNLHTAALENAAKGDLQEDDYISVIGVYASMNSLNVNDLKWFRIEHSIAGIICCHGTDTSDEFVIQNLISGLS